ncbi:hypothetical protein BU24DRAFT_461947 [Aaosphaeria arxii CBS 175.79]|uniref:HAD-like protein n=1 Tax=Aaosphaeria arxii CBS 175.79 TaxID=1450172 RepID=A0A6A5XTZ4_9PLEO|nr:uncharacterized protein BU24DRAFT_461947 [Aaosphaeria arxii CBS 175.79]KAF2015714.1 hypothetical protein BU24DRAFT_461947 [Aaosphaeria arxii CBS 175.79]
MPTPAILPNRAIQWVLDWDGTITLKDTLDALVNISRQIKPTSGIPEAWSSLTQAYLSDLDTALSTHAPSGKLPTNVLDERSLLLKLRAVEQASVSRVSDSQIFQSLTDKDIKNGARDAVKQGRVQLRNGYLDFESHLSSRMDRQHEDIDVVNILSVNWSQHFIASCLNTASEASAWESKLANFVHSWPNPIGAYGLSKSKQIQEQVSSLHCPSYMANLMPFQKRISANELEGLGDGSTGVICAGGDDLIVSSSDKLTTFQKMRKMNPYTMKPIPVVYVGDSWTDFDCLLAADLGICIRDEELTSTQRKLHESFERLGIKCPHLKDWKTADDWAVVWVRDFAEIKDWLSSLEDDAAAAAAAT